MRISFVINEPIQSASGGYKIVYTYANEMVKRGHKVKIYYHCRKNTLLSNYKFPMFIKLFISRCLAIIGPRWFDLDRKVKRTIITKISDKNINNADVVIATASDTAQGVYKLNNDKGEKYYFIQGYENWLLSHDELSDTYKYNMKKIVVSKWLKLLVEEISGDSVECVLNGIDKNVFYIKVFPEMRKNTTICMLYHDLESKGSKEGLEVLIRLKEKYTDLVVYLFGVVDKPPSIPEWIDYTQNATEEQLCDIYNKSNIYLSTSWNEGFGLTGAEAMMSGCALVSTMTDGVKEYANSDIAKLVRVHDLDGMYNMCCELIDNPQKRCIMARKGANYVTELLDYNNAVENFINIICEE